MPVIRVVRPPEPSAMRDKESSIIFNSRRPNIILQTPSPLTHTHTPWSILRDSPCLLLGPNEAHLLHFLPRQNEVSKEVLSRRSLLLPHICNERYLTLSSSLNLNPNHRTTNLASGSMPSPRRSPVSPHESSSPLANRHRPSMGSHPNSPVDLPPTRAIIEHVRTQSWGKHSLSSMHSHHTRSPSSGQQFQIQGTLIPSLALHSVL